MTCRLFIITLLLLAVNEFCGTNAQAAAVLKTVTRSDESGHLLLFLHFDRLPGFTLSTNGRSVEVELPNTAPDESLVSPATDGRLIKMVSKVDNNTTTLSFYFRYPPQKVSTESNKDTGLLMLDILLGNQLSTSYPELSSRLQGVSVMKRLPSDSLNPVNTSIYAKDWLSFFTRYESPVTIFPQAQLHLPPFPLAAILPPQMAVDDWLPAETQALANQGKWSQVFQLLREQVPEQTKEELKERLVLTYAEALIRAGEYREPYFLLQRIVLQYPNSLMADLAHFLLIYQQADRGDHINAYYELNDLVKKIDETSFSGSFSLLLAELAMMGNLPVEAEKLLDDPALSTNESLTHLRQLRHADLLSIKKQKVKALTGYLELTGQFPRVNSDPMSLAHFADALYAAQRFPEAAQRYQQLSELLHDRPGMDLALFRLAMSQLQIPETKRRARIQLQQIQNAFPQTEGGVRALLKQTDLDFTAKKIPARKAEEVYGKYAVEAELVVLREESAFKQALVNSLSGEGETSVNQCMHLLRTFQTGRLRTEATALLIQQLPDVVKQQVKNKDYVKALVLTKQNRQLFSRGWMDTALLYDLARAYSQLGMADQTAQTYQYLLEISGEYEKENLYLPLIETLSASGQHLQVEEYADRYQLRYPKGKDVPAVFVFKVRSLYARGQHDTVLKLMAAESSPRIRELELLKGTILFNRRQWQQTIDTLTQPDVRQLLAQHSMLLPLAESYFHVGNNDQAAILFNQIIQDKGAGEQARYRLAQIASKKGNTGQALNLLTELAEKGTDQLWSKLAREEIAILQLDQIQ
jgi:TolA-binding protein